MATLTQELERFKTARYGEDVRDAFVECIRKIHEENGRVVDLKNEIKQLTEQFELTSEDLAKAVTDALAEYNRKYEAVKGVAESAESTANGAEATASNAVFTAEEALDQIGTAVGLTNQLDSKVQSMQLVLNDKLDGAYVENGYLWLTSDGVEVVGPLGPFSGGGGGGGSAGNNAVLQVSNTTGWLSKTVAAGKDVPLSFYWESIEDDLETGPGVVKVQVNGVVKAVTAIAQGTQTIKVSDYLATGSNVIKLTVSDSYENSRTINYSVNVIDLSLTSTFDASQIFTGNIRFPYTPVGAAAKTVHIILDGKEIKTVSTSSSGRQLTYMIPQQPHGAHKLRVYFDATVNGEVIESNELYYELICVSSLSEMPIITSGFNETTKPQYGQILVPYVVYMPNSLTAEIELRVNGLTVSKQTVDRTQQLWTYRADTVGALTLQIVCGSVAKTIELTITESDIDVEAETENLALYLTSAGRSNNEENPAEWKSGETSATFEGFNWSSDGWVQDEAGLTAMRVGGDARLTIGYKPFASDFRITGKTIELEFATHDVMNYDSPIISCMQGGRGFSITSQLARLASEQSSVEMQFKEDERVRLSFVVEKRAEQRLIYIYINGIMSGCVRYPSDDDFAQVSPVNISVGSSDAVVDLYTVRIYDNDLTRHQVLTNWIADTQDLDDMIARYTSNSVFDEYSSIVIGQLPADLPYLILEGPELPQYKGDKKTVGGSYVDPVNRGRSFTFSGAQIDVQGTSSQYYARKNYKLKLKEGYTTNSGAHADKYAMNDDAIPTDTFCFKADVASSEGCNNVELVRIYNSACPYKTPPQKANPKVRQGIDGFPMVVFWNDGTHTEFIGKYNFNNDKSTEEVFGFVEGDESWEIKNNTSNRVLFKDADFGGSDFLNDFEGRYPDGNEDGTELRKLIAWIASTDQSAATGSALPAAVSYGGTSYTADTAAYRLAKFKAELAQHMEVDAVVFYYLFTELYLMVDSRAKNAFPSHLGGDKWFSLPYDFDTAIGINNEGTLAFSYNLEDIDKTETGADVFNGQQSVLWINLRQAFYSEITAMYQNLRSTGKLSYELTEAAFEAHQAKWPAAIFNEDAYFKYLAPLIEQGNASYLSMLQGSKEQQRKWWLYNRFRYMDSKYNAGDALTDVITVRGYAKSDVSITPYADVYASVKFGSYLVQTRAARNQSYTLACPLTSVNDTEIYIYSASQLKSVGDLSGLKVGYADFSNATKLQELKLGDASSSYSNTNLQELHMGNNRLLKKIDVRNSPNLTSAVDLSGCKNIEEIYFEGTAITGLQLPNGGIIKKLHVPGTLANLTIRNQRNIADFQMPAVNGKYPNLTTVWLENSSLDMIEMLGKLEANTRLRLIGIEWQFENAAAVSAFYDKLDTMRGMDEQGNNTDKPQVSGTVHVPQLTGTDMAALQARYPTIKVTFDHLTSYCHFYNHDGSELLKTVTVIDGANAVFGQANPTRAQTAQYTYTFAGWSKEPNGAAQSDALTAVIADRNVYAAYTATVRRYTVYFYNGSTLLQTVQNVPYGGSASYTAGSTSSITNSQGDPFTGWNPLPTNIRGNTSCYAQFVPIYDCVFKNGSETLYTVRVQQGQSVTYAGPDMTNVEDANGNPWCGWDKPLTNIQANTTFNAIFYSFGETITDSWEQIAAHVSAGDYATRYSVGDIKVLDLGTEGKVGMQIIAFDKDTKTDGSKAAITWLSKELLKTSKRWNPSLVSGVSEMKYTGVNKFVPDGDGYKNTNQTQGNTKSQGLWRITASADATLTLNWTTDSEGNYDRLRVYFGTTNKGEFSGEGKSGTITQALTAGESLIVMAEYEKDKSGDKGSDTATVAFTGENLTVEQIDTETLIMEGKAATTGTGTVGGWENSELRTYYRETLLPLIPSAVRSSIVPVTKTHPAYRSKSTDLGKTEQFTQTSTETVWCPSYSEMFSSGAANYKNFFTNDESRKKSKVSASSASWWWLRSANGGNIAGNVNSGGNVNASNVSSVGALALGFCF